MSAKATHIGVIGCGLIGRKHHALIQTGPQCVVIGAVDPSGEAQRFAADLGVA